MVERSRSRRLPPYCCPLRTSLEIWVDPSFSYNGMRWPAVTYWSYAQRVSGLAIRYRCPQPRLRPQLRIERAGADSHGGEVLVTPDCDRLEAGMGAERPEDVADVVPHGLGAEV